MHNEVGTCAEILPKSILKPSSLSLFIHGHQFSCLKIQLGRNKNRASSNFISAKASLRSVSYGS